ncbi:unnamed protein product, partial [Owenia fusiformis]
IFNGKGACLLIDVFELFKTKYFELFNETCPFSSKWLLIQLSSTFGKHLKVFTSHSKKHSLMLFYETISKEAHHIALYKLRKAAQEEERRKETLAVESEPPNVEPDVFSNNSVSIINGHFHQNSKQIVDYYKHHPMEVKNFTFDSLLKHISPKVWNYFLILTSTQEEKRAMLQDPTFSPLHHYKLPKRSFKRLSVLQSLLSLVNDECTYPMHIAVAEYIKRCSGSVQLVTACNRLGFCASEDSRLRFETRVKKEEQSKTVSEKLDLKTFTVVTADNIDVQTPHAMVTGNDRSWHGTSVMAIQPRPSKQCTIEQNTREMGYSVETSLSNDIPEPQPLLNTAVPVTLKKFPVYGDGRCLFRGVSCILNKDLQNAVRNQHGMCVNQQMEMYERNAADNLRSRVVQEINSQMDTLRELDDGTKAVLLDNFSSFGERVTNVTQPAAYAGMLEIITLAYLLKTPIHMYREENGNYKLHSKLPPCFTEKPITLLYRPDEPGQPGHYDALLNNNFKSLSVPLNDANDLDASFQAWRSLTKHNNNIHYADTFNFDLAAETDNVIPSTPIVAGAPPADTISQTTPHVSKNNTSLETAETSRVLFPESRSHVETVSKPRQRGNTKQPVYSSLLPTSNVEKRTLDPRILEQTDCLEKFHSHGNELVQLEKLKTACFTYIFERDCQLRLIQEKCLPGLRCKLALETQPSTDKSKIIYLDILDLPADRRETLKIVLAKLFDDFKISTELSHLVVVGDAKTYDYILKLRQDYGDILDWVIPWMGDWHILKNFQPILMKIYWDAGWKEIAQKTHKGSTLTSLANAKHFKRTHYFILQSWEAIYSYQLRSFKQHLGLEQKEDLVSLENSVASLLQDLAAKNDDFEESFVTRQGLLRNDLDKFGDAFEDFCSEMSDKFETFRMWNKFLKEDAMAYISLYLAIRERNWDLRNAAIKSMAPLFTAFDAHNYSRLLPQHISHILTLPNDVSEQFQSGAFAVSLKGTNYASVGLDEAHEMTINKEVKEVLFRINPHTIGAITDYITTSADIVQNLNVNLQRKSPITADSVETILESEQYPESGRVNFKESSPKFIEKECANVKQYLEKFSESSAFSVSQSKDLHHAFTGAEANELQKDGLLNYTTIGTEDYSTYVETRILKRPSTIPPRKKHKLHTFTARRITKTKLKQEEKERKFVTSLYKRTIAMSVSEDLPVQDLFQFLETPRAICTVEGLPYKGNKSSTVEYFTKRYNNVDSPVTNDILPISTNISAAIIEGMNIIYISPIGCHKFLKDYASFLMYRFVDHYFRQGYSDVRIIFDQQGTQGLSPKMVERERRGTVEENDADISISGDTAVPRGEKWIKFIQNKTNREQVMSFLSYYFLNNVSKILRNHNQIFITGGGFQGEHFGKTMVVRKECITEYHLQTSTEETDLSLWLHVKDTQESNILVISKDTDIGLIGLPLEIHDKNVYIQYKSGAEQRYLELNALKNAISRDPDLGTIISSGVNVFKVIQMVYIASGCDFVSYFAGHGKTSFFKTFFKHAEFVTSGRFDKCPGTLDNSCSEKQNEGLLAFFRLIGCLYFHSNRACLNSYDSPEAVFKACYKDGMNIKYQHSKFLNTIRKASWKGVYEDQLLPSDDALRFHWLRSCWLAQVWSKALTPFFLFPSIEDYGYIVQEGKVSYKWDSPANIDKIKTNVAYLTRGCGCKSGCKTSVCKCYKQHAKGGRGSCGPGCICRNCTNPYGRAKKLVVDSDSESESDNDLQGNTDSEGE